MKLFCIPYAGGSATIYYPWKRQLLPNVQVIPLELAGRGERMGEPFYSDIGGDGADDLFARIAPMLDGSPFALFGHSMGTLFAYELAHRIRRETGAFPAHVLLSGRGAPHTRYGKTPIHGLPDQQFQEEVLRLGGTPKEVFENEELSQIYTPILRADYRLCETYLDSGKTEKLACPITVMRGTQDHYSREEAEAWRTYARGDVRIIEFEGGHFFIHECRDQVVEAIFKSLFQPSSLV